MSAIVHGFLIQMGLIVSVGAQNAFILRQGIKGEHILMIILICIVSDAVAISVGVTGFSALMYAIPWLGTVLRLGGAAFLIFYGLNCALSAARGKSRLDISGETAGSAKMTALACLAFTWLNPQFYVDTMGLIGSLSAHYPGHQMNFGLGAILGSVVFFFTFGYGSRLLRPVLSKPKACRALDAGIAASMWCIAAGLVVSI